jgi:hypothetical protein
MSSSCSSPAASTTLTSEQRPGSCCPCCQLPQCKAWKKTANTVQKLETETCLAAGMYLTDNRVKKCVMD